MKILGFMGREAIAGIKTIIVWSLRKIKPTAEDDNTFNVKSYLSAERFLFYLIH